MTPCLRNSRELSVGVLDKQNSVKCEFFVLFVFRNQENVQRRMLRDVTNPYEMQEEDFQKSFRLSRQLTRNLIDALRPHLRQNQRINGLTPEAKVLYLVFKITGNLVY